MKDYVENHQDPQCIDSPADAILYEKSHADSIPTAESISVANQTNLDNAEIVALLENAVTWGHVTKIGKQYRVWKFTHNHTFTGKTLLEALRNAKEVICATIPQVAENCDNGTNTPETPANATGADLDGKNGQERCCGNCISFLNEDSGGYGVCDIDTSANSCHNVCNVWEARI